MPTAPDSPSVARPRPASGARRLLESQRRWAAQREIELADPDHVRDVASNLRSPLHPATLDELDQRPDAPLARPPSGDDKPVPMSSLVSTWALVCNVFDAWRERDVAAIGAACAVPDAKTIDFGHPPAHVWIEGAGAAPTAVVASFVEPYQNGRSAARPEREAIDSADWSSLTGCRHLALDLWANPRRSTRLPAAQLLDASRALTEQHGPRGFRLLYVWYDLGERAARALRTEIDSFRMRVGAEVDFEALSWQALFARIPHGPESARYRADLADRYFRDERLVDPPRDS